MFAPLAAASVRGASVHGPWKASVTGSDAGAGVPLAFGDGAAAACAAAMSASAIAPVSSAPTDAMQMERAPSAYAAAMASPADTRRSKWLSPSLPVASRHARVPRGFGSSVVRKRPACASSPSARRSRWRIRWAHTPECSKSLSSSH